MQLPFVFQKKNKRGLIGVDIQPQGIAVAHILFAEKPGNKPVLKQCAFQACDPDSPEDKLLTLKKLLSSFPIKNFYCNASIGQLAYELLLIDAPKVESSELKQAVRWRIKEQLPYQVDDAVIDVFEIPGQPVNRQQLMYVVSALQSDIDEQAELLKQAGLDIQSIDIYELVQRNIAAIMPEDKEGLVLLKIDTKGGLLTITRNGTLYLTRNIDFNINRLRVALEQSEIDQESEITLSLDELEEQSDTDNNRNNTINLQNEPASSAAEINQETAALSERSKAIIDELILEIQRSLDYYVSHFNQRPVTKIVFAPMEPQAEDVINYIHEMLGIKTEILDFNRYLSVKAALENSLQVQCFNAIGLALRQDEV